MPSTLPTVFPTSQPSLTLSSSPTTSPSSSPTTVNVLVACRSSQLHSLLQHLLLLQQPHHLLNLLQIPHFPLYFPNKYLHDLDVVVRQSRSLYASLIQETPAFKNEPAISRMIADFLYFRLIPIEIYLPDETSVCALVNLGLKKISEIRRICIMSLLHYLPI